MANNNNSSYIRCDSSDPYIHHPYQAHHGTKTTTTTTKSSLSLLTPREINEQVLHLRFAFPENYPTLVRIIAFCNAIFIAWWEPYLFRKQVVQQEPPQKVDVVVSHHSVRRRVVQWLWHSIYFPLHRTLFHRSTAIHPDASLEYHALYTLMYWGRFFPVTIERMRFSLQNLAIASASDVDSPITHVQQPMNDIKIVQSQTQQQHCTVKGIWLHCRSSRNQDDDDNESNHPVLMWLYGGAFLAGDTMGNANAADFIGRATQMDVFLPEYRLVPEANLDDIVWDVCLAYRWLVQQKKRRKVILVGVSSGGALCVRLAQLLCEQERGEELLPSHVGSLLSSSNGTEPLPKPLGAALLGPFVDYTEPRTEAFLHYPKHDLVVNQRVVEYTRYLDTHIPGGKRKEYSPVHRSLKGLPPLCVVVSAHEAVYDQCRELVNAARSQGVKVRLGVWNYMCHAFPMMYGLIPEGRESMEFVRDWILELKETVA